MSPPKKSVSRLPIDSRSASACSSRFSPRILFFYTVSTCRWLDLSIHGRILFQRGNMIPGGSYGAIDLQGSIHMHHHQNPNPSFHHHPPQSSFCQHQALTMQPPINHVKVCDQQLGNPITDRGKDSPSDEDELSLNTDDGGVFQNEVGKGKKGSPWQRVKWSDLMVRLLITAVSYLGQDAFSELNMIGRRKAAMMQKKGKWRLISKVLAERGFYVSPQQCEDKFNDLNKRYKRLTDILGRGTSCKIVENPALLDLMDHVSDKSKDEVRKILSSKQLFYEEMCSYHNGNRLNLPANPALQRSLQLALRSDGDNDSKKIALDDGDDDDDVHGDSEEEEEDNMLHGSYCHKRMRHGMDHEEMGFLNTVCSPEFNKRLSGLTIPMETSLAFSDDSKAVWMQMEMMRSRSFQLDEQSLHIQSQMLKLEKQRSKWQRLSKKKDRELDKMRMENERMKFENEQLALDLKRKELEIGHN